MSYSHWPKRDPIKNYFPAPNEIYQLGLSANAIYGYLLSIEDREPYSVRSRAPRTVTALGVSIKLSDSENPAFR